MKIAHCIHGLGLGGAQKVLETLVTSLSDSDLQHFVYCSLDGPLRSNLQTAGVKVEIVPRSLPKLDPHLIRALSNFFRADGIEIVHTHLFGDSLHGFLAARAAGRIPTLMTLHNDQKRFNWLQQIGYRWMLPRCSAVVACSNSVGSSFLRDQPTLQGRLTVIPNGIGFVTPPERNPEEVARLKSELKLQPSTQVIAAMGRFVEQKGYRYLIQGFSRMPPDLREGSQLLLLGEGPMEQGLKELARSLELADRVVFGGYRQDIAEILRITDVVAFSSLWEGLPIALLEAMAAKKCIVATDIESFRDVVESNHEALLALPRDPTSLGSALARVLSDKNLRAELSGRARERYLRDFTAAKMVRSYEILYRRLSH